MYTLQEIFWATDYADGSEFHEPGENLTIRGARPFPLHLIVTHGDPEGRERFPIVLIELTEDQPIPVFYRTHSITLDGSTDTPTIAVVFGRGGVKDGQVHAQLWMIDRDNGEALDCSATWLDQGAVELLAEAYT